MNAVVAGVAPIFALIALGWGLRASRFMPAEAWGPVERITYFVFYPAFLIPAVWRADFTSLSAGPLGLACIGSVLLTAALAVAAKRLTGLDGPAFTSVFQGLIRWNSFVFLPLAAVLFGPQGAALSAIVVGALVPVVNVISVLALSRWGAGQARGWRHVPAALARNPILIACLIGAILNLAQAQRPLPVANLLALVSAAALPLGLLTAGAGLDFAYARRRPGLIGAVSAVKLLILPLMMWGLCRLLGGDLLAQGVALLCGSAPGAAASYVLARRMGGDAPLMAGIVAVTTAASLVTVPLLLLALGALPAA